MAYNYNPPQSGKNLSRDTEEEILGMSSSTIDTSSEDLKPNLTLLSESVSMSGLTETDEYEDSLDGDTFSPQPVISQTVTLQHVTAAGTAGPEGDPSRKPEKKGKKGSKKGNGPMKGIKLGAAVADDLSTIGSKGAGRGQHKLQATHLTSSLLEEVLNEKKMALLKSPEVIQHLQRLQKDIMTNCKSPNRPATASSAASATATTATPASAVEASSTDDGAKRRPTEEYSSGRQQNQSASSIWSKGASAFSSVGTSTSGGSGPAT